MPVNSPKELHSRLVHPSIAAPVVTHFLTFNETTTDDATQASVFMASRKMRFVGGTYIQAGEATAATSFVATVQVSTQVLSAALDIKTLAADAVGTFTPSLVSADRDIVQGDLVDIVFNQEGDTVTAPGVCTITLEFQLIE